MDGKEAVAAADLLTRRVEHAQHLVALAEDQIKQAAMRPLELSLRVDARDNYIKATRELAAAVRAQGAGTRGAG